ncbi:MAG: nodulation protein NfeD [Vicinamibacterales bacterium]
MLVIRLRRRLRVFLQLIPTLGLLLMAAFSVVGLYAQQQDSKGRNVVLVADVDALIHPVSAEYIAQTLDRAADQEVELVVLMLKTPGGLVDSTREINTSIIESKTPVVVYVGPSGTRAASAGFLITIAADIAAMAPGTHIGAAHPVSGTGEAMDDTAAQKAASDVAAYARSLASQRERNVRLSEEAVTESRSFTEDEALAADPPLIDLIAVDLDDLLEQLDQKQVRRWNGDIETLSTKDAIVVMTEMTWRQQLLSAIAHPQIAVLLFSLGSLGLTIELWNPGATVPGVVGGLCLLLAFFAFQILPINYVGLLLIAFGLLLLVLEMFTPTFGLLAAGGVVSMVMGAVMLVDSSAPELQLGWPFILSSMLTLGLITAGLVRLGVRAQRTASVTGVTGMIDQIGQVRTEISSGKTGSVVTRGEIWLAKSDSADVCEGEKIRVVAVEGMTLTVEPVKTKSYERSET